MFMDVSHHPPANATVDDIKSCSFPKGDDPSRFVALRERAREGAIKPDEVEKRFVAWR